MVGKFCGVKRTSMPSFLKPRARSPRAQALAGPLLLMPLLLAGAARADIVALFGSGTEVRTVGTTREISAGVKRGSNQFFRLSEFNTRTEGISDVQFKDVQFKNDLVNVIVGVTSKSEINKPVGLALKGNLYFLSPLGIRIERGAAFNNVNTLLLTTSSKLALGENIFDVYATDVAANLTEEPKTKLAEILINNLKEGDTNDSRFFGNLNSDDTWQAESFDRSKSFGIQIAEGSSLTVDKSLLLVTHKAPITISSASLTARGETPGNPNAFKEDQFGQGDGLAIVTQNLIITGSATQRSAFTSNTEILIREPLPIDSPGVGSLASKLYDKDTTQIDGVSYSGTVSMLKITGLDMFSGDNVPIGSTWKVLLRSYGLACTAKNCGQGKSSVTPDDDGIERFKLGRDAVVNDFNQNPDNLEITPGDKIGYAIYAGVDLTDTRIISGYAYDAPDQSTFKLSALARLEFGFDPGNRRGGGRLEGLQFYAPDVAQIATVYLGSNEIPEETYDTKKHFPTQGPVAQTFLNNKDYAKELGPDKTPDGGMYWFYNGDGGGNNSISVTVATSLPMINPTVGKDNKDNPIGGGGGNNSITITNATDNSVVGNNGVSNSRDQPRPDLRPTQNTYIFDNTLFVIDQNVSEDYESASSASSSKSALLTVNLAPARSVPKGRCGSGSNQAECKPVSKP